MWCGPSAMSAMLNIPTHECAAILREVTGRPAIIGLYPSELIAGLKHDGAEFMVKFYGEWFPDPLNRKKDNRLGQCYRGNPDTLSKWLKTAHPGRYAICSKHHWIAVYVFDGTHRIGEWADSKNRRPRPLASAPMRMRVTCAIRMED